MSSSIGNVSTGASFQTVHRQPSEDEILKKIEKDFGKDAALKNVTDDNGKIDKTKLEDFLKSQGVQPPQGGKPPGGAGDAGQGDATGGGQQAGGASGQSGGSSSSGSSTEVKSETRQKNPDGSVTTTITYKDDSVKKTTSQSDAEKALDSYKLQHPEKDVKKHSEEAKKGSLVSVKI